MKVSVKVIGQPDVYTGWTEVDITRSLDDASSSFNLATVDIGADILSGDYVEIKYGKFLVMSGIVDSARESYSATDHIFQISGRSLTKDIVDCSAVPKEWIATKLPKIVEEMLKPYNILIDIGAEGNVIIPKFTIEKSGSETVLSAIQRLATTQKLIVTDTSAGRLKISGVGTQVTQNSILNKKGDLNSNVISGEHLDDESNRYSEVQVRSQVKGTDETFGKSAQQIGQSAFDKSMTRKRVLIIDSPRTLSANETKELAAWQMASNYGKSIELTYEVFGWTGQDGLWDINQLVKTSDDFFSTETINYLISKVNFKISESGTTTTLTLNPPEAYIPESVITKAPHGKKKRHVKTKETTKYWEEKDGV